MSLVVGKVAVVDDPCPAALGGVAHQHVVDVAADAQRCQQKGGPGRQPLDNGAYIVQRADVGGSDVPEVMCIR